LLRPARRELKTFAKVKENTMNFTSLCIKPLALACALTFAPVFADTPAGAPVKVDTVDLKYEKFQLDNGLTVLVHEDHKAPIVAVSVWYHIGSADEPEGKTGFAHLFEHLMFSGSENHKDGYFKPFELVGATDMNGTTADDRTNYFETVPTTALDMALWMESDRMGHLLGAIGQKELDTQRGVVQNEKRQDENQPYGRVGENINANVYPANHPYHHDTIGSMKDLNAASLADVKQWFHDHYGAANTTIVLAGDITPAQAKEKVTKYFGDIPAGPPVARQQPWIAPLDKDTRGEMVDQVPQVSVFRTWNVPPRGDADLPLLELAASALGGGKTSRLYQRLIYKDKIADNVQVGVDANSLASQFGLQVDVKQGVDPKKVETAIADEFAKFLKDGPTQDELDRARVQNHAQFVRAMEKVGGSGGVTTVLAQGQVYFDDPAFYKTQFARLDAATPASVRDAAAKWLSHSSYTLTVKPGTPDPDKDEAEIAGRPALDGAPKPVLPAAHEYTTVKSDVDRSKGVPVVTSFPDLVFPKLQHGKLKNGIEVVLAERHAIPVVKISMLFDSGYAADQGHKPGTASFTAAMLDEGTTTLDSLAIARKRESLGAAVGGGCDLDMCSVGVDALKSQLDPSLALWSDVLRHPAFRAEDINRVRGQWLANIAQEKTEPTTLALRVLPPLLYGKGHAYAVPLTGSGNEASIKALTDKDLRAFVGDWLRPDNAKIVVAGDITLDDIIARLDTAIGDWTAPKTALPKKNLALVPVPAKPRVYVMDRPGSQQSVIIAGLVAPSTMAPNNVEINTMNNAFGGLFTSRLNMNLREDKHWAYGAFSFLQNAVGQRPYLLYAPVQSDKTADSMKEMLSEAQGLVGDKPLTATEIAKVKASDVRALPGEFETTQSVLGAVQGIVTYHRPDDWVQTSKARIESQKDADVEAAAREVIKPNGLTWVVVGDRKQIEKSIKDLKIGDVQVLDADGNVVK
jgi:zinc protease